ncbi:MULTISPECIES: DUF397 domain-containing protein [unclassified Streptomyces]|uniref:DUF397 domain-containing protein n=1 Tax=unclassified Streptomyces TaxID=2593676 RepID=UPI002E19A607
MSARLTWFKSSYSDSQGGNCLEVARAPQRIHIRDSKLGPQGPTFTTAAPAWKSFLAHLHTA